MDLHHHLLAVDLAGGAGHPALPADRLPHRLVHRHPPGPDPRRLAVPDHHPLLGQPADPHRQPEVSDPRQRPAERRADGPGRDRRPAAAGQHQPRRAAGPVLLLPALHGAADLCRGRTLQLRALRSRRRPLRQPLGHLARDRPAGGQARHHRRLHPGLRALAGCLPRPRPAGRRQDLHDRQPDRRTVQGQPGQLALRRRRVDDPDDSGDDRPSGLCPRAIPGGR